MVPAFSFAAEVSASANAAIMLNVIVAATPVLTMRAVRAGWALLRPVLDCGCRTAGFVGCDCLVVPVVFGSLVIVVFTFVFFWFVVVVARRTAAR